MSNLKYFMQYQPSQEIIEVPGVAMFKDEAGEPVPLKIRKLTTEQLDDLLNKFRKRSVALDRKRKPIVNGNALVYDQTFDQEGAGKALIVEALVQPDLKDKELMDYYGCYNIMDMPKKVFSCFEDYNYVSDMVSKVLGIGGDTDDDGDDLETVKNLSAPETEQI